MESTHNNLDDIILDDIDEDDAFGVSFSPSPFESMMDVIFPLDATGNPRFNFTDCDLMHQAFVSKVTSTMHGKGKWKDASRQVACRK
jgi:hypothetical protein